MKKISVIGMVAVLLISGSAVLGSSETNNASEKHVDLISFSTPQLREQNTETLVFLAEATSHLSTPGEYPLPVVTTVYTFPFKTQIIDVTVDFYDTVQKTLKNPVQRTAEPIADRLQETVDNEGDTTNTQRFPSQPFGYHTAAGRNGDSIVTYLAVQLYPVTYFPAENTISSAQNAQITITYIPSEIEPMIYTDDYSLLIIAPSAFASSLQPLVTHKIAHGLTTKLVQLNEISESVYFPVQGRDAAEEMKYFIKDAVENWGTDYVLLVGGRKGGLMKETWWLPVRYSNLDDGSERQFLTDLYFADIYDAQGNFSCWDSNGNDIFGEWTLTRKDIIDMYPDVFVGRLACNNVNQVKIMVDKIITYETTAYDSDWFKRYVGIAGDTYPTVGDPYFEGEMANSAAFEQIEPLGFQATMLWTSNSLFKGPDAVIDEISKGCGFAHFSGHGNPFAWGNHPPQNKTFINGPNAFEMRKYSNKNQLPIVLVGGCHNAQFNTSLMNMIKGLLEEKLQYFAYKNTLGSFWRYEWVPRCWAWSMASQKNGGAIAVMANTGYGYGTPGANALLQRGRHMEWLFFKAYQEGKHNLGETHSYDIMYFMNEHPPMSDRIDCKIAQQWVLLGDPSLLIGGYSS